MPTIFRPGMSTEIYLIRHGQTEWNALGRFQGRLDSPLTAQGRAQAQRIGLRLGTVLKGAPLPLLYASPLGRARQTAEIVALHAGLAPPRLDDRLQEHSLGSWDGLTLDDIEARRPELLTGSTPHDWFFRSPDGETLDAARERTQAWLAEAQGTVVVVTHALISRVLRGLYAGLGEEETLSLPIPQDVIWRLRDDTIETIPA